MPNKNFLLLSLEDEKTRKIANVVSNESCKKILDYLAEHEGTETEIAKKLNIPLSTVHYNLQQLVGTGLIAAEEYHYSPKGKEVLHYKITNKYIIIAPKNVTGLRQKLRRILPIGLITLGAAALVQLFSNYFSQSASSQNFMMAKSAEIAEPMAEAAQKMSAPSLMQGAQNATTTITTKTVYLVPENIALWFLLGAFFALGLYLLWGWIRKD